MLALAASPVAASAWAQDMGYYNNGILMFIAAGNNDDNRHTIYGFTRGYNLGKRCCS